MRRLVFLPLVLSVASDSLRLGERLERFEGRVRLLEPLDERDDGMAYFHDAENKSARTASGADRETDDSEIGKWSRRQRSDIATHSVW